MREQTDHYYPVPQCAVIHPCLPGMQCQAHAHLDGVTCNGNPHFYRDDKGSNNFVWVDNPWNSTQALQVRRSQ